MSLRIGNPRSKVYLFFNKILGAVRIKRRDIPALSFKLEIGFLIAAGYKQQHAKQK